MCGVENVVDKVLDEFCGVRDVRVVGERVVRDRVVLNLFDGVKVVFEGILNCGVSVFCVVGGDDVWVWCYLCVRFIFLRERFFIV